MNNPHKYDKVTLILLALRALGSVFAFATTYWIINAAYEADLSPAVALSFTSLTMFLVAIIFFFLYHEKLTLRLFLGMILVLLAVALIAANKAVK